LSQRTVLEIPELSCRMCVRHVERALEGLTGVLHVEVDLGRREVTVDDDGSVRREAVIQAVQEAGYRARVSR
jgi:copper chaperone CopZ